MNKSDKSFPNDDPEFLIAFSEIQPIFESLLDHKVKFTFYYFKTLFTNNKYYYRQKTKHLVVY